MTQPREHILRAITLGPARNGGSVNHQNRQAQRPRGDQLGIGTTAASVLAHHQIDGVRLHQLAVAHDGKWPAINDQGVMGQARRLLRRVHETQQIVVVWLRGEGFDMHPPQRQHDAAGLSCQRGDRAVDISNAGPAVTSNRFPRATGHGDMGHTHKPRSLHRMTAHRRGKGVGRVDQMGHAMVAQIIGQPSHPAEPANPHRNRLSAGIFRPSGIAECRRNALRGKQAGKNARLGRSTQQEDMSHG